MLVGFFLLVFTDEYNHQEMSVKAESLNEMLLLVLLKRKMTFMGNGVRQGTT